MTTRRSDSPPSTTLATWNLEWAKAGSERGKRAAALLDGCADIVVLTECDEQMLLENGRIAPSAPWEAEPSFDGARKVAMWSKFGWTDIDDAPIASAGGRCVVATTETAVGPLTVVGVCIPWHDAGKGDATRWQLHEEFLVLLENLLTQLDGQVVIAGDFNQRRPTTFVPTHLVDLLDRVFAEHPVVTFDDPDLIDHVALSNCLGGSVLRTLPERTDDDKKISDHTGVVVEISRRSNGD